ncbi:hypothetical protein [Streptomyces sp. HNM0574]|uniref:hypothetical protein n=1 Tax=Streptomyces sp. HNM0574 TaxID=2714954 RepID=UPI00146E50A1|nr:hypothetical protein [Streptomyces sp. HNM0574]NLU70189.1 hypothetical protein [Streptomyces sp. HNM0574]
MSGPAPRWGEQPRPPEPPRKQHRLRTALLAVLGALVVLIAIGVVATGGGDEDPPQPPSATSENTGREEEKPEGDEADDVTRLELVDHSAYGVADVRVEYEFTNRSGEKSDYEVTYEVVNEKTDKRVWQSVLLETGVKPGQSATGEDPINVPEGTGAEQLEVKVTEVDRTASF